MPTQNQRIHILPTFLANQIAAGEVIERPASVVKELLENSLDANATHIRIDISQGGLENIRVEDNGQGVHPDDMLLTISAHATSKIHKTEDLENITSLGFRGEALASISAVSQLTLTSLQANGVHAWQVKASGRDSSPCVQPAAHPIGTSVQVAELFYNTPARRKFLKSARTEWQYTEEVIQGILLSRFDVDFSLHHNGKKLARYPIESAAHRIAKVFSPAFIEVAHVIDAKTTQLELTGFVAPCDFTRSSYDWQYFYVNGRRVKDKLIQHAMRQAFADLLYPGRYAAYVLYLKLDPSHLDVNVHPTKHEVRFAAPRLVHDFIVKSVQEVLHLPKVFEKKTASHTIAKAMIDTPLAAGGEFLTVLNQQLIISKTETGLGLIDLHAYFSYQAYQCLNKENITRQPLFPVQTFQVSDKQQAIILQNHEALTQLGFIIDAISADHCVLREIPAILSRATTEQLWKILLNTSATEYITQLSCAAIPQTGIHLSTTEITHMLETIDTLPQNARCPHGFKVWQIWSPEEIRKS